MYVLMHVCICVCMYLYMYICMCVCMYVYVIFVCMYVCIHEGFIMSAALRGSAGKAAAEEVFLSIVC